MIFDAVTYDLICVPGYMEKILSLCNSLLVGEVCISLV